MHLEPLIGGLFYPVGPSDVRRSRQGGDIEYSGLLGREFIGGHPQRLCDGRLTIGVTCRLHKLPGQILASTSCVERVPEMSGRSGKTDSVVSAVHDVNTVPFDSVHVVEQLTTSHETAEEHVVNLKRSKWHQDSRRLHHRLNTVLILVQV